MPKKNYNTKFPILIYYAYKEGKTANEQESEFKDITVSKGWETLLHALISEGFQITGTWPMKTETGKKAVTGKEALLP